MRTALSVSFEMEDGLLAIIKASPTTIPAHSRGRALRRDFQFGKRLLVRNRHLTLLLLKRAAFQSRSPCRTGLAMFTTRLIPTQRSSSIVEAKLPARNLKIRFQENYSSFRERNLVRST